MFNAQQAQLAINFFQRLLTHTKGEYARSPFHLWPFQRSIVWDLWGTLNADGSRQYRTAYIEEPKKNGKTELVGGIGLLGLFMDDEPGAEIYLAASTRDQASILFRVAAQMVRNQPPLKDRCRIVDSTKTIFLKNDPGSFLKAISADAGTQDGVNPHMVLFDELHRQRTRDLHSVLKYGAATRRQPLFIEITTAGIEGESPLCWEEHEYARQILQGIFKDPTFYPVIYALDRDEDWTIEGAPAEHDAAGNVTRAATGWYKANPALGKFLPVDVMRQEFQQALRLPSAQNEFRRFRLNQWVAQETRWIPLSEWDECGEPFNPYDLVGQPCWGAFDLSTTIDITALSLVFPRTGAPVINGDTGEQEERTDFYALTYFWLPQDNLHERCIKDRVPYDVWAGQQLVHLTPGNYIDHAFVKQTIKELRAIYDIREMAYDPWNAAQLASELAADDLPMAKFPQSFAGMNEPSKSFERAILGRRLHHGGNPVLRWMMNCTTVQTDPTGSIKPVKPDRLKNSKRIDGIVTTIMSLSRARANASVQISPPSITLL